MNAHLSPCWSLEHSRLFQLVLSALCGVKFRGNQCWQSPVLHVNALLLERYFTVCAEL